MEHIGTFGASTYRISALQLFRDAEEAPLAAALAHCAIVRLAPGVALQDGARARLYIVLRGALAEKTADGDLNTILPGESVGEQSVLDEAANLAAISAIDATDLLVIEADLAWQLIERSNGVARNLLRLLSFRIRAAGALLRRRQKLGEFYRQLSMKDGLTGLYNRAWLGEMLPAMLGAARRSGAPLSVIMVDLDHFKRFNDQHGHLAGDAALRTAACVISAALRPSDCAVRYGGEEMLVILPETCATLASVVAERLCQRLRQAVVLEDMRAPMPHMTGSFGVAMLEARMDELQLVAAADAALYRAKEAGRDRVAL